MAGIVMAVGHVAGLMVGMDQAIHEITLDVMGGDELAQEPFGVLGQVPQLAGVLLAEMGFQVLLVAPLASVDLPAIAAGGAAAYLAGLQQHHVHPRLRQIQGGRQASIAAAHHHHVGTGIRQQRRERRCRAGRAAYQEAG